MGGVSLIGPCSAIEDVGKEAGDDGTHAGAILQFVVPDALETGGEQITDARQAYRD